MFLKSSLFSAFLFATLASITNFAVSAAAVTDLEGSIGGVAEKAGGGGGGDGVTTSLFFSGFCSKG